MDAAATTAGWLSFVVTAIGLGSLITQASGIQDRLDPYHTSRTAEYLGAWKKRQPKKAFGPLAQPTPVGPVIHAKLVDGFCGINVIGVSRLPLDKPGKASWTALLAIFHEQAPSLVLNPNTKVLTSGIRNNFDTQYNREGHSDHSSDVGAGSCSPQKLSWTTLQARPLTRHNSTTSIAISRATLITILVLCNSRATFSYSDASGHRASYASYCGVFYVEWPLGAPATVHFHPHDSHAISTDVYPLTLPVRVDKCVQIMAGVITSADGQSFQCAFPGRKPPGKWTLEYQRKGFPGAHGSRHLWNLMGGKVHEVDLLYARWLDEEAPPDALKLRLPSTENTPLTLVVPKTEQSVLEHALDCLPWSSLSWSIHRGLRDILVAYAKPTMDKYRQSLASRLRDFIEEQPHQLEANGWSAGFVRGGMAELASNSVLAGRGNSGDAVRVVTDAAFLLLSKDTTELDEVDFWRTDRHDPSKEEAQLSSNAIIALTKCFVLEWSIEFDYQMYHELPPELLFL